MLDIEKVKEAGYKITEIDEEIYIIEDFISEEERLQLFNLADSTSEEDWSKSYMKNLAEQAKIQFNRDDLDNIISRYKSACQQYIVVNKNIEHYQNIVNDIDKFILILDKLTIKVQSE